MTTIIVPAGQVSAPQAVAPGVVVTATPATGGTAFVEYTLGSLADIQNGVAVWYAWPKGTVSANAAAVFSKIGYARCTSVGAPAVLDTNFAPNNVQSAQFSPDWAGRSSNLVAQSVAPFILTGTTVETTAAQPVIPAGSLKAGGRLKIYAFGQSAAGRAGFWQYRIYFNNVLVASQNNATGIGSGSLAVDLFATSLSTQVAVPAAESLTSASLPTQFAADLTVDNVVKITMTNASAADTTQVLGYSIEAINP